MKIFRVVTSVLSVLLLLSVFHFPIHAQDMEGDPVVEEDPIEEPPPEEIEEPGTEDPVEEPPDEVEEPPVEEPVEEPEEIEDLDDVAKGLQELMNSGYQPQPGTTCCMCFDNDCCLGFSQESCNEDGDVAREILEAFLELVQIDASQVCNLCDQCDLNQFTEEEDARYLDMCDLCVFEAAFDGFICEIGADGAGIGFGNGSGLSGGACRLNRGGPSSPGLSLLMMMGLWAGSLLLTRASFLAA